jgi:hypothetical protein
MNIGPRGSSSTLAALTEAKPGGKPRLMDDDRHSRRFHGILICPFAVRPHVHGDDWILQIIAVADCCANPSSESDRYWLRQRHKLFIGRCAVDKSQNDESRRSAERRQRMVPSVRAVVDTDISGNAERPGAGQVG